MKKIGLATALVLGLSSSAHAFWEVKNSEEDVFGNVNVTATSFGDNGNLIRIECGSSSEPFLAFLIRDNSKDIREIPAKFLHKDQNGNRHESDATLGSWNEKYVAVKVTDTETLRRLAEHMTVAKKSIPLGISIPFTDVKVADTFSPRGSTLAGRTVLENCFSD